MFLIFFSEKVAGIDTNKIAITSDLKKLLGNDNDYKNFVAMAVLAWSVLRQNYEEILDYARLVFAYLYPQEEVESFLRTMLRIDEDTKDAMEFRYIYIIILQFILFLSLFSFYSINYFYVSFFI